MTESINTYARVQDVELRVGDLVATRVFTSATVPNIIQVEGLLDAAAAEMNAVLRGAGYTVPISEAADPHEFEWARQANAAGAAARALNIMPGQAVNVPDAEAENNPVLNRRSGLWAEFRAFLKAAKAGELACTSTLSKIARIKVGSAQDVDDNYTVPSFERGMFDFPGTRELTEAE